MSGAVTKMRNALGGRARMVAGGVVAVGAVVAGVVVGRDRSSLDLPAPEEVAAEAALSVHNAAKATVIAAVRESERPDLVLLRNTVKEALREGVQAGVDLTAVTLGTVEGAAAIARLLGVEQTAAASAAARAAMEVAEAQGRVAAARIQETLAPHGLTD